MVSKLCHKPNGNEIVHNQGWNFYNIVSPYFGEDPSKAEAPNSYS